MTFANHGVNRFLHGLVWSKWLLSLLDQVSITTGLLIMQNRAVVGSLFPYLPYFSLCKVCWVCKMFFISGPGAKRSCKWHFYVFNVFFQDNRPSNWGFIVSFQLLSTISSLYLHRYLVLQSYVCSFGSNFSLLNKPIQSRKLQCVPE